MPYYSDTHPNRRHIDELLGERLAHDVWPGEDTVNAAIVSEAS
ncbi:MAG TPA: hypothetical protein VEI45_04345 [Mycobacterium sp.]|nr:hypothetical protein [Mycobacterium sp.]HXY63587.1 hypothetical protein [Mycobacterium sp.]